MQTSTSIGPSRARLASYYVQRVVINRTMRALVVRSLGILIGKRAEKRAKVHPLLNTIKEQGIAQLGQILSDAKCADVLNYLADKPVYDRDESVPHAFSAQQSENMSFGIHRTEDVIDCPHLMELISSQEIIQLAQNYLGCTPTLSCLGVQWSFSTATPRVAQTFHRDSEDWKFLRFFVYLTDVEEGCGPHVYVKGSHKDGLPLRLKFYSQEEISQRYGDASVFKVYGKRGTGIVADTSGIHKGELPDNKPRLVLNFTYSIFPNPFSEYDPVLSRHSSDFHNYSNRLYLR